jgi:hypothetical protein
MVFCSFSFFLSLSLSVSFFLSVFLFDKGDHVTSVCSRFLVCVNAIFRLQRGCTSSSSGCVCSPPPVWAFWFPSACGSSLPECWAFWSCYSSRSSPKVIATPSLADLVVTTGFIALILSFQSWPRAVAVCDAEFVVSFCNRVSGELRIKSVLGCGKECSFPCDASDCSAHIFFFFFFVFFWLSAFLFLSALLARACLECSLSLVLCLSNCREWPLPGRRQLLLLHQLGMIATLFIFLLFSLRLYQLLVCFG